MIWISDEFVDTFARTGPVSETELNVKIEK